MIIIMIIIVGGFNKPLCLSPELANLLGVKEPMPRPQIVKAMWVYIKDNDLQDPNDKRCIILDDSMKQVFQRDQFDMFGMNKYLKRHLRTPEELEKSGGWDQIERDGESSEEDEEERAAKLARKKRKKEAAKNKKGKRKRRKLAPGVGFNKLLTLSDELADFIGEKYMARPQVVKKLWDHIKANDLQNPENKKEIFCDSKLTKLLGEEKVTMFTMNKFLKVHFQGPAPEEVNAAFIAKAEKDAAPEEESEEEEEEESEEEESEEEEDSE